MGYKGLIIKIQKLKANYDREIADIQKYDYYNPECSKEGTLEFYQNFSDELENILESECYGMKKYFKF